MATMQPKEFLVEEYKQLHDQIKGYQQSYTQLENLTFGGVVVVYGFLLINLEKIPKQTWWAIPLIIAIAGMRCFAYYWIINRRHAVHLAAIEREMYEGKFPGFQSSLLGREWNLMFNAVVWIALFAGAVLAAYWRIVIYSPIVAD
jgi:hypothetical protein